MSTEQRFRFVIALVARSGRADLADLACRVLKCHPGSAVVERLGHGGLNWVVCVSAEDSPFLGLPPQVNAMIARVQPVLAGLTAAHVIETSSPHSCREVDEIGEFVGGELSLPV